MAIPRPARQARCLPLQYAPNDNTVTNAQWRARALILWDRRQRAAAHRHRLGHHSTTD